jgi:hypothetical protein
MATENYWRYADAWQQQAMVAAAATTAGMALAASVAQAATAAVGMQQHQHQHQHQQAALAQQQQQSAAPSLKRARPDYGVGGEFAPPPPDLRLWNLDLELFWLFCVGIVSWLVVGSVYIDVGEIFL